MVERGREVVADLAEHSPPVDAEELAEATALLEWMADDHFIFLGYREYDLVREDGESALRRVPGTGLGILRDSDPDPGASPSSRREAQALAREKNVLDPDEGQLPGHRAPARLPRLRRRQALRRVRRGRGRAPLPGPLHVDGVQRPARTRSHCCAARSRKVRERSGLRPGSHDGKALIEVLETYPRDELFQISEDELFEIAMGILAPRGAPAGPPLRPPRPIRPVPLLPRLPAAGPLQHPSPGGDPGHPAGGLQRHDGRLQRPSLGVGARPAPLRHPHAPGETVPDYDVARDRGTARGGDALLGRRPAATRSSSSSARSMAPSSSRRYRRGVPGRLPRRLHRRRRRWLDIQRIERLDPAGDLAMTPVPPARGGRRLLPPQAVPLRAADPPLRRAAPPREHGRPGDRRAALRGRPGRPGRRLDLRLRAHERGWRPRPDAVGDAFKDAFGQVWRGEIENDGFNRLVLRAGAVLAGGRVLRAYGKYLRQTGTTFSQSVHGRDVGPPSATSPGRLVELFHARFDPALADGAGGRGRVARQADRGRRSTRSPSLDEDRILRSFLHLSWPRCARTTSSSTATVGRSPTSPSSSTRDLVPDLPLPMPALRDLRVLAEDRGRAPAGGQGGTGRDPLVRPPGGLPHRGPRPDEGPDGEERGDRAGRSQGRIRRQAPAGRPRRPPRRRSSPATGRSSAGCST